jgi:hypothetical protein
MCPHIQVNHTCATIKNKHKKKPTWDIYHWPSQHKPDRKHVYMDSRKHETGFEKCIKNSGEKMDKI